MAEIKIKGDISGSTTIKAPDSGSDEVIELSSALASKVDYATPMNAQSGTAYTFVADDAKRLTTASNGSAVTFTIPPQSSVAWGDDTILRVVNYGAGALTVAGGSGVTVTNTATVINQYGGGTAIRTGSDTWTFVPFGAGEAPLSEVEYLVIAGGGGGSQGSNGSGGGGAGGYRCSVSGENSGGGASAESAFSVTGGTTYTITVGAGGAASSVGSNSVFDSITSVGGGNGSNGGGGSGGSGGGARGSGSLGGSGTSGQGYAGGDGASLAGGGGGGAGGAGQNGTIRTGGVGVSSSITGSSVGRAGGGGGVSNSATGSASDGGGAGSLSSTNSGTVNTGGGGGARRDSGTAGSGGSGVVIIRYPDTFPDASATTGSPSLTTSGGYKIYTFTGSGTITW